MGDESLRGDSTLYIRRKFAIVEFLLAILLQFVDVCGIIYIMDIYNRIIVR